MKCTFCATILLFVALATAQQYDHVTITTGPFVSSFAPLGQFLETELGLNDTAVTVEDIYGHYPGRDNPEQIRNFIRYAYQNWGTTHVLLGGDAEFVPCRQVWARCWWGSITLLMPSDLYYSDLDGDWNADGDTIFGEAADSVDLYPDVFVGRLPASGTAGADQMVAKFRTYCSDSTAPYLANVLLTGFDIDDSTFGYSTSEFYDATLIPPALRPCTKVYEYSSGNHKAAIQNALNAGPHLFVHMEHCDASRIGAGWLRHGLTISRDELRTLTNGNNYTIMLLSFGCFTGCFDTTDCVIEYALDAPNGGAVAGLANARYGLYGRDAGQNPQRTLSALQGERFLQFIFSGGPATLEQFAQTQASLVPLADTSEPDRWCMYNLNLFGEPCMPIWLPVLTGVADPPGGVGMTRSAVLPSHVSGSLVLAGRVTLTMTDILGRTVMHLQPGTNNLSRVPPGVYFLRTTDRSFRLVGRIVKINEE
jgi:hypothetical protein